MSFRIFVEGLEEIIRNMGTAELAGRDTSIRLSADADYAIYVEQGTTRMAAHPYLQPAVDQSMDEIAQLAQSGMIEVLQTGDASAMRREMERGAQLLEERAQSIVHVVTGTLRASIHAEVM